ALRRWMDELVEKLQRASASGLRPGDVAFKTDGERRVMLPAKREKVARALCDYLRSSREYTYTLDLRRQDYEIDPTEDFLRNVKQGHCDRYAGALALLCRGVGIP